MVPVFTTRSPWQPLGHLSPCHLSGPTDIPLGARDGWTSCDTAGCPHQSGMSPALRSVGCPQPRDAVPIPARDAGRCGQRGDGERGVSVRMSVCLCSLEGPWARRPWASTCIPVAMGSLCYLLEGKVCALSGGTGTHVGAHQAPLAKEKLPLGYFYWVFFEGLFVCFYKLRCFL